MGEFALEALLTVVLFMARGSKIGIMIVSREIGEQGDGTRVVVIIVIDAAKNVGFVWVPGFGMATDGGNGFQIESVVHTS